MAVILIGNQTTILPNPQLTDSVNGINTVNLRRTMTGARVTYVKRRTRKRYLWSFQLTTEKAWELRSFVQNYGSQRIVIRDWLDNMYYAYLKSNPIEFNHANSDANCWAEAVEVTLEWEGELIPPHASIEMTVPGTQNVGTGDQEIGGLVSFVYDFSENVTVNVTGGTVTFALAPPGIISVIGNGTSSVTINGSMSAINAMFAGSVLVNVPMSAITVTLEITASAASSNTVIKSFNLVS